MKSFEASSTINASPDRIWAILTDGAHFPDWDSGVFGPLLSMMWCSMPDLGPSFAQFANGLKQRVEQPA